MLQFRLQSVSIGPRGAISPVFRFSSFYPNLGFLVYLPRLPMIMANKQEPTGPGTPRTTRSQLFHRGDARERGRGVPRRCPTEAPQFFFLFLLRACPNQRAPPPPRGSNSRVATISKSMARCRRNPGTVVGVLCCGQVCMPGLSALDPLPRLAGLLDAASCAQPATSAGHA